MWRAIIFIECLLCTPDALHLCYIFNPPSNSDLSSPDPTFPPRCPASRCPNQNQPTLFHSAGTFRHSLPHFPISCLIVPSRIDKEPREKGCIRLSWGRLFPQHLAWRETLQRASSVFVNEEMTAEGSNVLWDKAGIWNPRFSHKEEITG